MNRSAARLDDARWTARYPGASAMADQAQGLRDLADRALHGREMPTSAIAEQRTAARTIAITSGKGGVGKTNLCANLAIRMGSGGSRVVVLDADLGLANAHMLLGITPRHQLDHVLRGERTIDEVLCPAHRNVELVAGASDITAAADLDPEQTVALVAELASLDRRADIVLVDTGAGLSSSVRAFILAVEEVVVVTTPEPTAIADAYATMKVVARENPGAAIRLVVNMARDASDAEAAAKRLRLVCRRFLGIEIDCLGWVPQDPAVPRAVRAQRPILLEQPSCPAAAAIAGIAQSLGCHGDGRRGATGFVSRVLGLLSRSGRLRDPIERNTTCPRAN